MRRTILTAGYAFLVFTILALGTAPVASAVTTTIPPATAYEELVSADDGDSITYSWDADGSVRFIIRGPGGNVLVNVIDESDFDIFDISQTGTYRFTWENLESVVVSLEYDVTVLPFSGFEDVFDTAKWIFWGVIIGSVLFAAIIIILLVVLLRGDRQRVPQGYVPPPAAPYGWPQYQYGSPPPARPAASTATCSKCSAPIDPQSGFCSKCGAKQKQA